MSGFFLKPILESIEVLGKKWTVDILFHLMNKPKRYSELVSLIPDVSSKMLALRLTQLQELNLIEKIVYNIMPLKSSYNLILASGSLNQLFYYLAVFGVEMLTNKEMDEDAKEDTTKVKEVLAQFYLSTHQ